MRPPARVLLAALVCLWLVPGAAAAGEGIDLSVTTVPETAAPDAADLTVVDAAVFPPRGGRLVPYVGVDGASVPEPGHSAGVATDEVERVDLRARLGLRLAATREASVRFFLTIAAATVDAENRVDTHGADPLASLGLAFIHSF